MPKAIDIIADRVEALLCVQCGETLDLRDLEPLTLVRCPKCETEQPVPLQLGNFYLLEELGRGGMGMVYKALDQTLGRYVAIKVMRKELGEDAKALENFLHEARAAAALNHRNVVQIYSCGKEKGQPYIVMEMVGGGRLDLLMEERRPLDEQRVLEIGIDVAQGLGAAKEVGLVHGDIKPANVLFGKENEAKVVDFGLARFVASQQAPGEVWGTPFYIAPEKVRKEPEDHRSDMYSLGATLFHILVAQPPFDEKTARETVLVRLKKPAPDARECLETVHPETAALLTRMLNSDPRRRHPTYKSLLWDMRSALGAVRKGPVILTDDSTGGKKKRLLVYGLTLLATVLLAGGGAWWMLGRDKSGGEPERKPISHRFVDGKLVPVYEGDEPPPEQTSSAKTPPPKPIVPEGGGKLDTTQTKMLHGAFQALSRGKPSTVQPILADLGKDAPPGSERALWIQLLGAVDVWALGETEQFAKATEALGQLEEPEGKGAVHEAWSMAYTAGQFLQGTIDKSELATRARAWSPNDRRMRRFLMGVAAMNAGDLKDAEDEFKGYGQNEASLAYVLEPLAGTLAAQLSSWRKVRAATTHAADDRKFTKALNDLRAFRGKALPPLRAPVSERIAEIEKAAATAKNRKAKENQKKAAEAERAKAEHERLVAVDMERIEKARQAQKRQVAAKDFDQAASRFNEGTSALETDEGRARQRAVAEGYASMDAVKKFVIDAIQAGARPEIPTRELGGDIVGANKNGLRVSKGGRVEFVKPWRQISARTFVNLSALLLEQGKLPAKRHAKLLLGLASYCYEGGALEPASSYASEAEKLDKAVRPEIDLRMPGLLEKK